ncbi:MULTISPECIES: UbiA family prenyltransferase [Halobacterium]|uniref:UbiA family prenyltransferase n=1 Tax=Halobacterium TaxID=2239 RepID=UPI00073F344C|nr:UbiA family prenyltransferase [Halobacterium sp. CBA1132]MCG1003245.1 UbiA family prenyltransferase [Halobacterium noricense]
MTAEPRTARALLANVKPTFMLPAVGLAAAGSALAPSVSLPLAAAHAAAVATALYTAHVVDDYVDAHVRGEHAPVLSATTAKVAAVASSIAFVALAALLWTAGARAAVAATLPLWTLAVLHAPALDKHPVTVTVDYPVGVALAFAGGALAQTGRLAPGVAAVAVVLAVSLSGLKVSIDRLDREFDRSVDKRTLPVLLGDRTSTRVAAGIHVSAAALVVGFVAAAVLPALALVAAVAALADAALAVTVAPRRSARAQMALAYPLTAALLAGQCANAGCAAAEIAGLAG